MSTILWCRRWFSFGDKAQVYPAGLLPGGLCTLRRIGGVVAGGEATTPVEALPALLLRTYVYRSNNRTTSKTLFMLTYLLGDLEEYVRLQYDCEPVVKEDIYWVLVVTRPGSSQTGGPLFP